MFATCVNGLGRGGETRWAGRAGLPSRLSNRHPGSHSGSFRIEGALAFHPHSTQRVPDGNDISRGLAPAPHLQSFVSHTVSDTRIHLSDGTIFVCEVLQGSLI